LPASHFFAESLTDIELPLPLTELLTLKTQPSTTEFFLQSLSTLLNANSAFLNVKPSTSQFCLKT
tara:strand:+ start:118 stop:312 length:195 start_codon:yes stop_codon:yes gene_type:complete